DPAVNVSVLLFEEQGGAAPAPQGLGGLPASLAYGTGEIELAAVARPPAVSDGVTGQAVRDSVPVLPDRTQVPHGPHLAHLLINPAVAGRFHGKRLRRVGHEEDAGGRDPCLTLGKPRLAMAAHEIGKDLRRLA